MEVFRSLPLHASGFTMDSPSPARAAASWLAARRLVIAVGLAAALPVIVSAVEILATGWVPIADDALIAVSGLDVLTRDSPLLGPWSSGYSAVTGEPTYHPGPLLFWLLAIAARLPAPGALELTAGFVNVVSVIGVVALAHRRGGRPLMMVVAIGIPIMLGSLPADALSDIWNPSAPLLPFTLLIFLCWSLACGEHRLLPVTVLVGSLPPQSHLSFLVPTLGALAVGIGGLVLTRRSQRAGNGSLRPWVIGAIVVALLCWSAPLADQAVNRPGNLVLIARAATTDQATVGLDPAWRAVVHTVGVVPWWLGEPQIGLERVIDLVTVPNAFTIGSAVVTLAGLMALTLIGLRRRRADVVAAGALGLVLCAALVPVTASTPQDSFGTLEYGLRWASPVGMFVWLALAWMLTTLFAPHFLAGARQESLLAFSGRPAAALLGVGLVAAVGTLVAIGGELKPEPYDEMRIIADRLETELDPSTDVLVDVVSAPDGAFMALGIGSGIVYSLRREGRAVSAPVFADYLGREYGARPGPRQLVRVDVDSPAPESARVITRLTVPDAIDPNDPLAPKAAPTRSLIVSVAPVAPR